MDSFLLKFSIEELLGWPVQLISDGLLDGVESALNLTGAASIFAALASGEAHIHPEARRLIALFLSLGLFTSADSAQASRRFSLSIRQAHVVERRLGLRFDGP